MAYEIFNSRFKGITLSSSAYIYGRTMKVIFEFVILKVSLVSNYSAPLFLVVDWYCSLNIIEEEAPLIRNFSSTNF